MQDLKGSLSDGRSLALKINGKIYEYNGSGIAPLLSAVQRLGRSLKGGLAADKIVGKAAALLFAYAGISRVYAETLSVSAQKILEDSGITYEYSTLTPKIMNRAGTDICPMEKLCAETSSPQAAFDLLCRAVFKG